MHFSWILTILFLRPAFATDFNGTCRNAFSCFSGNIIAPDSQHVECDGYRSCQQATKIQTSSTNGIYCYGSYSCEKSTLISRTGTASSGDVRCYGLNACANVEYIETDGGFVNCAAEYSCTNTRINSQGRINCRGYHSCSNSNITLSTDTSIYLDGALSAMNSVLYSGDNDVSFVFEGFDSGYNTTIVCNHNQICTVVCRGASCDGLNLTCNDGANCTFTADCDSAQRSSICPNGVCCTVYVFLLYVCFSSLNVFFFVFCLLLCCVFCC